MASFKQETSRQTHDTSTDFRLWFYSDAHTHIQRWTHFSTSKETAYTQWNVSTQPWPLHCSTQVYGRFYGVRTKQGTQYKQTLPNGDFHKLWNTQVWCIVQVWAGIPHTFFRPFLGVLPPLSVSTIACRPCAIIHYHSRISKLFSTLLCTCHFYHLERNSKLQITNTSIYIEKIYENYLNAT